MSDPENFKRPPSDVAGPPQEKMGGHGGDVAIDALLIMGVVTEAGIEPVSEDELRELMDTAYFPCGHMIRPIAYPSQEKLRTTTNDVFFRPRKKKYCTLPMNHTGRHNGDPSLLNPDVRRRYMNEKGITIKSLETVKEEAYEAGDIPDRRKKR